MYVSFQRFSVILSLLSSSRSHILWYVSLFASEQKQLCGGIPFLFLFPGGEMLLKVISASMTPPFSAGLSILPAHPEQKSLSFMWLALPGRLIERVRIFASCFILTEPKHKAKANLKATARRNKSEWGGFRFCAHSEGNRKSSKIEENKPLYPLFHSFLKLIISGGKQCNEIFISYNRNSAPHWISSLGFILILREDGHKNSFYTFFSFCQ